MGAAGRTFAERDYSWANITARLVDLYGSLACEPGKSGRLRRAFLSSALRTGARS